MACSPNVLWNPFWGTRSPIFFRERVPQCSCSPDDFGEHGNEILFPKTCFGNKGTKFLFPKHISGTREQNSIPQNMFREQGNEILFPKYIWGTWGTTNFPQMFPKFGEHVPECSQEHVTLLTLLPWMKLLKFLSFLLSLINSLLT